MFDSISTKDKLMQLDDLIEEIKITSTTDNTVTILINKNIVVTYYPESDAAEIQHDNTIDDFIASMIVDYVFSELNTIKEGKNEVSRGTHI